MTSPPSALMSRAVSESCCFDRRPTSDDDLDPDAKITWTLTHSASGKVNSDPVASISVSVRLLQASMVNVYPRHLLGRNPPRKKTYNPPKRLPNCVL